MDVLTQNLLARSLEYRDHLTPEERLVLDTAVQRTVSVPAGYDLILEGGRPTESCLMLSGFSVRYHLTRDGKRQISAFHIAGDFVDLHSFLLGTMDHSVATITEAKIGFVPHSFLRGVTETHPHLSRLLWLSTLIDAATHRRWIFASGQLDASSRIAHFLCEMFVRLQLIGHVEENSFRLPISQSLLGEAMGLSVVHVNRSLQRLRRLELIRWQGENVEITNWPELQKLAQFDPAYLNIERYPR